MSEHPVEQSISMVEVDADNVWRVGSGGITRIEATTKSGMHADIPYVRVWRGDDAVAEYCQHHILGVHFAKQEDRTDG